MFGRPLWRSLVTIRRFSNGQALSPAVRALVDRNNIDAAKITPNGPGGRLLKGDVLDYLQHRGSHDAAATPTIIVKWRTPPTVGDMWSRPSEHLIPHGFAVTNVKASQAMLDEQLEGMVVKATALTVKEMSQNSVNISVVMVTGGLMMTSMISSELVTMETPLNEISTLITQQQQHWNNATHQSTSPSICMCTKSGHLSFIDLTKLVMPTAPLLLMARLQDKDDHMISIAASHDLRVIDQSQTGEWLQAFQNNFHKL